MDNRDIEFDEGNGQRLARVREQAHRASERAGKGVDQASTRVGSGIYRASEAVARGTYRSRRFGSYLRDGKPADFSRDIQRMIRRHPFASVMLGFGAGVAVSRRRMARRVFKIAALALATQQVLDLMGPEQPPPPIEPPLH